MSVTPGSPSPRCRGRTGRRCSRHPGRRGAMPWLFSAWRAPVGSGTTSEHISSTRWGSHALGPTGRVGSLPLIGSSTKLSQPEGEPMLLDGFNHVALLTNNTDRLVTFYREVFEAHVDGQQQDGPGLRLTLIRIGESSELNVFEIA